MTPEQRARLAEGLAANHQRWLAGRYVAALSAEARAGLSVARIITRPESDAALRYRPFDERGLGLDEITRLPGYRFFAFSRPEEVLARVEALGAVMDDATVVGGRGTSRRCSRSGSGGRGATSRNCTPRPATGAT